MSYREPIEGMERKLSDLEEELARMQALPEATPAKPTAKKKSPKTSRPKASREERALHDRLVTLEGRLARAGYRELTEREKSTLKKSERLGVLMMVAALLVASFHIVSRAPLAMTWVESTCTIFEEEEDSHVARYVSHGRELQFSAPGQTTGARLRCWVAEPPKVGGLGRLDAPKSPAVSFWERISWVWLGTSAGALVMGLFVMLAVRQEAENRRMNVVVADDFSSSD